MTGLLLRRLRTNTRTQPEPGLEGAGRAPGAEQAWIAPGGEDGVPVASARPQTRRRQLLVMMITLSFAGLLRHMAPPGASAAVSPPRCRPRHLRPTPGCRAGRHHADLSRAFLVAASRNGKPWVSQDLTAGRPAELVRNCSCASSQPAPPVGRTWLLLRSAHAVPSTACVTGSRLLQATANGRLAAR